MSLINVANLTFTHSTLTSAAKLRESNKPRKRRRYESSADNIFENVSFAIDTDWKLGFIGRNGRGKTTFLKLLTGAYEYRGTISAAVSFDYFPFAVADGARDTLAVVEQICPGAEPWQIHREFSLLALPAELLDRPFGTLSGGEQTKALLAALFLKENNFLLIDEPTNHLDAEGRAVVAEYLRRKKSFILVSHDRCFLDACVDHILSLNRANIEVQRGNFSSWWQNKKNQDALELAENEKLKKDISRLQDSARRSAGWAAKTERGKYQIDRGSGAAYDKGFIGHKAAKMMQLAKNMERRRDAALAAKSRLLKNIETAEELKLFPLKFPQELLEISGLALFYGERPVFENLNLLIRNGERIRLQGKNGCGKTSLLKLLLGAEIKHTGLLRVPPGLKISYVSQDTSALRGSLDDFLAAHALDETLFKAILRKLDFARAQFAKNLEEYSGGQRKKVLLAKSLCEPAHLYIWDEPLNFIDVLSRMQLENLLLRYQPTMLFVEHDQMFAERIATRTLEL